MILFILQGFYLPKENKLKYTKFFIICASLLLLNGCLDDDDDSQSVAEAINAQTAVISEQEKNEASVTFSGVVVDVFDGEAVTSAFITVNLGSESIVKGLTATNGEFEIPSLPANSDIEVIISSDNEQFLTRAFFLNTGDSSANIAIKDFGTFAVSEPKVVQVTVLNSDDNTSIDNLVFNAYSHVGSSSSELKFKHTSTYDAVIGQYSITVPKHINTNIIANFDLDRDGEIDFIPESSNQVHRNNSDVYFNSANVSEVITVYVKENNVVENTDVEYRVSIVDSGSNSIISAELVVEDENNQMVKSVYDAITEQHVVSAKFSDQITLRMPAFTDNDTYYQSASIQLSNYNTSDLRVYTSGTNGNSSYVIPNSDVIELALLPRITTNQSALEVVTKTQIIDSDNSSFTVFYSQGVAIPNESISLERTTGFTIVKGNESNDDLILPGTTLFTGGLTIATSHTLTLNDTKLEVIPESPLVISGSYRYNVSNVEVNSTEEITDISDDLLSFQVVNSSQAFDINSVKLDNENFTTNGITITSVNTANEESSSSNNRGSVVFYLPSSIYSLKNFSMRQLSVIENNIERTDVSNYTFVDNGAVQSANYSRYATYKLASNEVVVKDAMTINLITSTAQENSQQVYRQGNSEYLSDNTETSINSISFEYAYETMTGDIFTGVITIPVQ